MDESILREAGHRLYITSRLKEMKRYLVFRARCRMHKDIMEDFLDFFAETPLRKGHRSGVDAGKTVRFRPADHTYAGRAGRS